MSGVGAQIHTTLVTRASLTPAPPGSAAPWIAFFFGSPSIAEPANPYAAGLAEVGDGWDGVVEVSTSTGLVTLTPEPRTSAVEVLTQLVRRAERQLGGTWGWYPQLDGRAVIVSTLVFDLVATGTTRTWLGFTGAYSGELGYVAHDPHVAGVYPSGGLLLQGADGVARVGQVGATGARVAGNRRADQSGSLTLYGAFEELAGLMDLWTASATWDVVLGGTWATRVRLQGAERERRGIGADKVQISLSAREVTL